MINNLNSLEAELGESISKRLKIDIYDYSIDEDNGILTRVKKEELS